MTDHFISRTDIERLPEIRTQHQFNDNAIRHSHNLSKETGMQRIGVHLVRLEPGRDSTTHHYHEADEEFIYVLSGSGTAKIGEQEFSIGAGDFMGFGTPSAAHSMRNTGSQDLVYLMGGENWATDVVHYPDLQRTMLKTNGRRTWTSWQNLQEVPARN